MARTSQGVPKRIDLAFGGPRSGHDVFEILVREHADMLTAYLRSLLRNNNAVDDIFQETMLVAWRRLDDYDRERPFGPWLRGIAGKLVLQHRRQSAGAALNCDPQMLEALDERFTETARMSGDTFRERAECLFNCIAKLPDKFREAIELTYGRDMLLKQIAESIDASEEAVKKRVQRARQMLADCLRSSEAKT